MLEENFDEYFREIYESEFIDSIFLTHESMVTKEDFISAIAGDLDEEPRCAWLFKPSQVRQKLQAKVDLEELLELCGE